jgi:putative colanic acid biosynthesis acetyltransferase WcaF
MSSLGQTRVRNDRFDRSLGYERGRGVAVFALWQLVKAVFFRPAFPWPSRLRVALLRAFGAEVGRGVYIKPQVNIHLPWKLRLGDHAWLGEEAFILNFEPISIGAHACVSQRAFLCGGNHDYRDEGMRYRNAPIVVGDGAWIGAQAFVGPGVEVGVDAVITAGSVLLQKAEPGRVYAGNPAVAKAWRWKAERPSGGREPGGPA